MCAHQHLAVADGLGGRAVAAAELGEREVASAGHVVAVLLDRVAPVRCARPALFLDQVVGEIRGEALAPVARPVVDEDAVAPPVVQDLVGIRAGEDEREANDARPEQRERRHAVAGLPEVLDERELRVGIRPEESPVHRQVLRGRIQVLARERLVLLPQVHQRLDRACRLAPDLQRAADEVDLVHRFRRRPADDAVRSARCARALADDVPVCRRVRLDRERDEGGVEVRIPERGAGQVDALGPDEPRRVAEAARVLFLLCAERRVDLAFVRQRHAARGRRCEAVSLDARRVESAAATVVAEEGARVAQRHFSRLRRRRGDAQCSVEQEFARHTRARREGDRVGHGHAMGGWCEGDRQGVRGMLRDRQGGVPQRYGNGHDDRERSAGRHADPYFFVH